jgi:hypothetical protein
VSKRLLVALLRLVRTLGKASHGWLAGPVRRPLGPARGTFPLLHVHEDQHCGGREEETITERIESWT